MHCDFYEKDSSHKLPTHNDYSSNPKVHKFFCWNKQVYNSPCCFATLHGVRFTTSSLTICKNRTIVTVSKIDVVLKRFFKLLKTSSTMWPTVSSYTVFWSTSGPNTQKVKVKIFETNQVANKVKVKIQTRSLFFFKIHKSQRTKSFRPNFEKPTCGSPRFTPFT